MLRSGFSATSHVSALLREALASGQFISAYLSAAGFDGIPPSGPIVLRVFASGGGSSADLGRMLHITEQEAGEVIDTLIQHGYLKGRVTPGASGRPIITISERGRAANDVAMDGLKAARWANFPFRRGDIVISTWPKMGTTWVQMICALLIFQSPELPAPLAELSLWPDLSRVSRDEVFAQLAAQKHRRFIKTHLPLNDIPDDPRATYIAVGRHPLDAALSLYHQNDNKVIEPDHTAPDLRTQRPVSPRESLLGWIDLDPSQVRYHYLAEMLRHLSAAWARRGDPNVILLHYEDLSADLEREMRRLAIRLGITVPEATWPGLVKAATFEHMRADPGRFLTSGLAFKDNAAFFRRGTSGEGRALLTLAEFERYRARVTRFAPPDLLVWLHREGRPG